MEVFRFITLTAGLISIIIAVSESVIPSEKYSKQLRLIFSLILILSIVSPFVQGKIDIADITDDVALTSADISGKSEAADRYFARSVENNISRSIGDMLSENKINFTEIKTSINISESYGISINEIEIAVSDTAREDEIIALVREKTDCGIVKVKESLQ